MIDGKTLRILEHIVDMGRPSFSETKNHGDYCRTTLDPWLHNRLVGK